MALEKLKIEVETAPGVYGSSFPVLFNPSQITLDKSVNWKSEGIAERNASEAEFTHGNPYTLALDLFFDTYEERTDVRAHTQKVANLLIVQGTLRQPPRCRLVWGRHDFNGYSWVLERLSQRFTLFLPDGTPARATLGCSFKQSQSAEEERIETSLRGMARFHTVLAGDTLAGIAARTYKNPKLWRSIAEANGIVNPRRLSPGVALLIPVLPLGLASKKNSERDDGTGRSAGYSVKIDDKPLDGVEVVSIMAHSDVAAPGVFELRLNNRSTRKGKAIFSDDGRFAVGNKVEIELGKIPERVMVGEITGLELEFRSGKEMLTVRGHDHGHRLLRGRKTRTFVGAEDSEIVSKVAEEARLEAKVESTGVKLPRVQQHNQTDWEFLQQRALGSGFEILMNDNVLEFRSPKNREQEVLTLQRDEDLIEFRPRLSTVGLASEIVVRGWSPKDKKAITARASDGAGTTMGDFGGLAVARSAFGTAVGTLTDRPISSQAEADLIAGGRWREMALAYIDGDGVAKGNARMKVGTVIRIDGLGRSFSGRYYVVSVSHTLLPERSFRTAFTVRRNAT